MRFLPQTLLGLSTIVELNASSIKASEIYKNPDPCTKVQVILKLRAPSVCDGDKYCTNLFWSKSHGDFASSGEEPVLCGQAVKWLLTYFKPPAPSEPQQEPVSPVTGSSSGVSKNFPEKPSREDLDMEKAIQLSPLEEERKQETEKKPTEVAPEKKRVKSGKKKSDKLGDDYETQLALAMKMSLEESKKAVKPEQPESKSETKPQSMMMAKGPIDQKPVKETPGKKKRAKKHQVVVSRAEQAQIDLAMKLSLEEAKSDFQSDPSKVVITDSKNAPIKNEKKSSVVLSGADESNPDIVPYYFDDADFIGGDFDIGAFDDLMDPARQQNLVSGSSDTFADELRRDFEWMKEQQMKERKVDDFSDTLEDLRRRDEALMRKQQLEERKDNAFTNEDIWRRDNEDENGRLSRLRNKWFRKPRPSKISMNRLTPDELKERERVARMSVDDQIKYLSERHDAGLEDEIEYDIDPIPGRRGFVNFGNSCWANAVFQALGHIMSFRSAVHEKLLPWVDVFGMGDSALGNFLRIVDKEMLNEGDVDSISPKTFFDRLTAEFPDGRFAKEHQQDAATFFTTMVGMMHEIDPITTEKLFGIRTFNQDYCRDCLDSRNIVDATFQPIFTLRCPENDVGLDTFKDCFENTTSAEIIQGAHDMKCKCGKPYSRRNILGAVHDDGPVLGPEILFIQVARKLHPNILEYPITLDLRSTPGATRLEGFYYLKSIIHHHGAHYTAEFFDPLFDTWMSASDRSVREVGTVSEMSETIYALVYERTMDF